MGEVSPVTVEVIKSRLSAIGQEMVSTMVRTAGTPIYAEIKDFSCGLFDYKNRQVVYSGLAVTHNLAIQNLVKTSTERYAENQGIFEGDVFIGNDPYFGGGIHAPELGLAAPIFVEGEILAWSGSIAHQLDIGGMSPGGFCLDSTDCFQEGIRFPPVKLFRQGELQQDIWDIHRNNVRLPEKIGMELKGQIAANNVARTRIQDLVRKFGVREFREACDALIALSARVTEEKIRKLPEGVYSHTDIEEAADVGEGLFPINCDLTVKGGTLTFDFTRQCPPQLPRSINCTSLVTSGMVFAHLMPLLCHDVPWNEGCTYPVSVVTTPGSVLDARPPAPCSNPSVSFRAADAALCALDKAMMNSPLMNRITACWEGSPPIVLGMAEGPPGHPPIMIPMLEGMSGGGGAFSTKDGLDAGSMLSIMEYSMGDVEVQENAYPILFLARRLLQGSGGPGRYRGGCGTLIAVMPHNAQGVRFYLLQDRRLVPSHGIMGGYPGGAHHLFVQRDVEMDTAARLGFAYPRELFAQMELLPARTVLDLGPRDVFAFTSNAGGGFGDPLNRDPHHVARDVKWELVSRGQAEEVYGVVLDSEGSGVAEEDTDVRRVALRAARSGKTPAVEQGVINARGDWVVLKEENGARIYQCSRCARSLGPFHENWKYGVNLQERRMDQVSPYIPGHDNVVLRQYSCPDCGQLLESEVTMASREPFWDARPLEP